MARRQYHGLAVVTCHAEPVAQQSRSTLLVLQSKNAGVVWARRCSTKCYTVNTHTPLIAVIVTETKYSQERTMRMVNPYCSNSSLLQESQLTSIRPFAIITCFTVGSIGSLMVRFPVAVMFSSPELFLWVPGVVGAACFHGKSRPSRLSGYLCILTGMTSTGWVLYKNFSGINHLLSSSRLCWAALLKQQYLLACCFLYRWIWVCVFCSWLFIAFYLLLDRIKKQ